MSQISRPSFAVIGIGPKGFYCLERLIAHLATVKLTQPVDIFLVHRDGPFGTSPVYNLHQPEYIILNVAVGEVDLWSCQDPPSFAGRGPNFIEWYAARYPDHDPLDGSEFLSRAIVGHYLKENFERLEATLPPHVQLFKCHGEAVDLEPREEQYQVHWRDQYDQLHCFTADQVLLATGHSRLKPTPQEHSLSMFADDNSPASFIPFVYPVSERLKAIEPGQKVAIKGLGLTFIDAVLELTEGRGGRFERDSGEPVIYHPSGLEPLIFPFSRTGLPMAPKAIDLPTFLRPLHFCTPEALTQLRNLHGQIGLEQGLWPLFQLEMQFYYYAWAMRGRFAQRLTRIKGNETAFKSLISDFHKAHPEIPAFDPKPLLDPVEPQHLQSGVAFHQLINETMEREIIRAKKGFAGDGLKSAVDIWYEVRYVISQTMAYGGLLPQSHRKLLEEINPVFKRVVFGPPLANMEKLHALLHAGILDFSVARAPQITTDQEQGLFVLNALGSTAHVQVLIDGRYPQIKLEQEASPLYQKLLTRRLVRPYIIHDLARSEKPYSPGSIDHTSNHHHIIDANGNAHSNLSVIGIPTEGNLLGNFTIVSDGFPTNWAKQAVEQLVQKRSTVGTN